MISPLKLGSLFAGIGGFEKAFSNQGFEPIWAVEIDKGCQSVLRRHFPKLQIFDDVCKVGKHNIEAVDVITFGSPCQDMSVAGKRKGIGGERSGLFFEATRIIRELDPAIAVWENVPGALSSNFGRDLLAVLNEMGRIGARDIAWSTLDAQYFGVPQRRKRVFLVSDFRKERAGEILFESEGVPRDLATSRKAGEGDTGAATVCASVSSKWAKGTGGPAGDECYNLIFDRRNLDVSNISHTIQTLEIPMICQPLKAHHPRANVDENLVAFHYNAGSKAGSMAITKNSSPTLKTDGPPAVYGVGHPGGETLKLNKKANTINGQTGSETTAMFNGGLQQGVRRLTPLECERLQGFPDNWTAEGVTPDGAIVPISDFARYRMLGNAVAVPVVEWIAKRSKETVCL